MTQNVHQRARDLAMAGRIEEISAVDRQWLDAHLAGCDECSLFSFALEEAIGALRLPGVTADTALVRSTQSRVRHRAAELRSQHAAMRPLWIAVAMVFAWATLTTPFLWAAFAWMGAALSLSAAEWRTGFFFAWIAPTLAASLLLLGSGSNRLRWRMAFGQNSEAL